MKIYICYVKPRILFTIGDINGIGPEIILKTLFHKEFYKRNDITIISPYSVIEYYSKQLKYKTIFERLKIIDIGTRKIKIQPGKIAADSGYIAGMSIEIAVSLCMSGKYDVIVTAPISKKALNLGGYNFDGHTEMLTSLSRAECTAMIMVSSKIKIGFATTHPPLRKVNSLISKKILQDKIKICYDSLCKDFGVDIPSIAVLSLNPHAGESGLIGDEEKKIISPAINSLKKKSNINLTGPFPSDSYFGNMTYRNFDLTFALYHDQGFIPFKMIAGNSGVNFTAGLKFIRTSPDHGTAYDIAGKGIADYKSFLQAVITAEQIHQNRIRKDLN